MGLDLKRSPSWCALSAVLCAVAQAGGAPAADVRALSGAAPDPAKGPFGMKT